jgi:transposase-like protein
METMAKKKPRPRRSFTPKFKAEIVQRCQASDRMIAHVVRDFDLTETAVRAWVNQADIDARPPGRADHRRAGGAHPAASGEPPVTGPRSWSTRYANCRASVYESP